MWFSVQLIYITALWIINDIPVHEYFYWFGVLQSKTEQNRILISLQTTSCCLTVSLSVHTADNNHTQTGTHFSQVWAHSTVCLWEYVGECKGIYSRSQMGGCSRKYRLRPKPSAVQSVRNWFQTHFQDTMFNNQKQPIINDFMAFFLLDMTFMNEFTFKHFIRQYFSPAASKPHTQDCGISQMKASVKDECENRPHLHNVNILRLVKHNLDRAEQFLGLLTAFIELEGLGRVLLAVFGVCFIQHL